MALCWYFFCSSVNLSVDVFTRLTDVRASNTFDFSIKARTSSLHRQIVTRSQRAYALGVMQIRLNLIVLISILFFWNIFAGYNYILYKFLLYPIGAFLLGILQRFLYASGLITGDLASWTKLFISMLISNYRLDFHVINLSYSLLHGRLI